MRTLRTGWYRWTEQRPSLKESKKKKSTMFCSDRGARIHPSNMSSVMKQVLKKVLSIPMPEDRKEHVAVPERHGEDNRFKTLEKQA